MLAITSHLHRTSLLAIHRYGSGAEGIVRTSSLYLNKWYHNSPIKLSSDDLDNGHVHFKVTPTKHPLMQKLKIGSPEVSYRCYIGEF